MADEAWSAGVQAWHEGLPVDELYQEAGAWARGALFGIERSREWARRVYRLGGEFVDGYLSTGKDAAEATDDTLLAARLREAELQRP